MEESESIATTNCPMKKKIDQLFETTHNMKPKSLDDMTFYFFRDFVDEVKPQVDKLKDRYTYQSALFNVGATFDEVNSHLTIIKVHSQTPPDDCPMVEMLDHIEHMIHAMKAVIKLVDQVKESTDKLCKGDKNDTE